MYWFDFSKLRELRKDNHLTQKAAGKLVGCTGPTVGRWERGEISITVEDLVKIADIYKVNDFSSFFAERLSNI